MAIKTLDIADFTVFERATFRFGSGINVLIGENATGKSHILKLLYALEYGVRTQQPRKGGQAKEIRLPTVARALRGVFRLQGQSFAPLVARRGGVALASVKMTWDNSGYLWFDIKRSGMVPAWAINAHAANPVYMPTREVLSIYPGLAALIRKREVEFDDTYEHLADNLSLPPLKVETSKRMSELLRSVYNALGGVELLKDGRFYVEFDHGRFEAHLVAEGLRKLATLARLIRNGSIGPGGILFWDEPESNLNPVLMRKVVDVLLGLASVGVQIFLASHDYLLTQTLSLEAEHPRARSPQMRFFGLERKGDGTVRVQQSNTLLGIKNNPILREHANQYKREIEAEERDEKPENERHPD